MLQGYIPIPQNKTKSLDTSKYTTLDIRKEIDELRHMFAAIGITEVNTNVYSIGFSRRMSKTFAYTRQLSEHRFEIVFNESYIHTASAADVHNTIVHEFCHTCKGCMNHGSEWKRIAALVNHYYDFTPIQRLGSSDEYTNYKKQNAKYSLTCKGCNKTWYYLRMQKSLKSAQRGNAHCLLCGSHQFEVKQLR